MISEKLVFIVGCPRSGTTWLQKLLAKHPRIKTGQESDLFDIYIGPQLRAWRKYKNPESSGRGMVGLACYLTEQEFLSILGDYMEKLLKAMIGDLCPGDIFVEKTPSHALYIPEIVELLKKCKIIHLIRDPRDTVSSIIAASKDWGKSWAPKYAWKAALMWLRHVKAAREAGRRLPDWQYLEVKYEDLFFSTSKKLIEIGDFVGIKWDKDNLKSTIEENCLKSAKIKGGTPIQLKGEAARRIGPMVNEPKGFIRRGIPGSWQKDLSLISRMQVWFIARNLMKTLGYSWKLAPFC